ncbi:MAG: hypothetical protein VXW82_05445, partial [Candidatus Thermoplasmatota archaeon]|nr:hypothetical protein [Candidatus Thermoplasmatota archaeon]
MAVEVEQRGNLRIVKMAGQASTQSFSMAFLPAIAKAIDEGLNDRSTKAMVLTGDGRFLSAGADLNPVPKAPQANNTPAVRRVFTGVLH